MWSQVDYKAARVWCNRHYVSRRMMFWMSFSIGAITFPSLFAQTTGNFWTTLSIFIAMWFAAYVFYTRSKREAQYAILRHLNGVFYDHQKYRNLIVGDPEFNLRRHRVAIQTRFDFRYVLKYEFPGVIEVEKWFSGACSPAIVFHEVEALLRDVSKESSRVRL